MIVLCIRANPDENIDKNMLYIWTGHEFEPSSDDP